MGARLGPDYASQVPILYTPLYLQGLSTPRPCPWFAEGLSREHRGGGEVKSRADWNLSRENSKKSFYISGVFSSFRYHPAMHDHRLIDLGYATKGLSFGFSGGYGYHETYSSYRLCVAGSGLCGVA